MKAEKTSRAGGISRKRVWEGHAAGVNSLKRIHTRLVLRIARRRGRLPHAALATGPVVGVVRKRVAEEAAET